MPYANPADKQRHNREYQARNREYFRAMNRLRDRRRWHVCPGAGGYACLVWLPRDRMLCNFCRRTLELAA